MLQADVDSIRKPIVKPIQPAAATGIVVQAASRFARPAKASGKSQYEKYPLPFFDRATRSAWRVTPSGNYSEDCELGRQYALDFLKSCDGTVGWSTLLNCIVRDMIKAGPDAYWKDGEPRMNGIVVGFLGVLGRAISVAPALGLTDELARF